MTATTSLVQKTENGAVYRTVFLAEGRRPAAAPPALLFTVTRDGALGFDNRQPCAGLCGKRRVSRLLAAEMAQAARDSVPGALAGRSRWGLAFELRVHYRAYRLGIRRSHAVTVEIGSPDPAAPDYDHNARWFEHPFRSLPAILKALLKD